MSTRNDIGKSQFIQVRMNANMADDVPDDGTAMSGGGGQAYPNNWTSERIKAGIASMIACMKSIAML